MQYNVSYREKDNSIQVIISYKDNGKWKQKSKQGFTKKREAKEYADVMLEELKKTAEKQTNLDYQDITFQEFKMLYINHKKIYNEHSTIRNIKFATNRLDELNYLKLEDIKSIHIQNCIDNMVTEGLSPNSIVTYMSIIKTLFNTAIDPYNLIRENPVTKIKIPSVKSDDKIKALTKYKLDELLNNITHDRTYVITLLAATCGLRLGEIMGLTWGNIDFHNKTLTVDKQWKKNRDGEWGFGTVKQTNSYRTIPIPRNTLNELKKYKKTNLTDINNRIILTSHKSSLGRDLKKYYNRAGYDITVHDLRHTYATMLISNGVDFKTAAKMLGHDIEMTMKTYSHVTDDMMNKATNAVNNIFNF